MTGLKVFIVTEYTSKGDLPPRELQASDALHAIRPALGNGNDLFGIAHSADRLTAHYQFSRHGNTGIRAKLKAGTETPPLGSPI